MSKALSAAASRSGFLSRRRGDAGGDGAGHAAGADLRGFWPWLMSPERRGALLVAPALILLLLMNIFPLMWSFGLSFFHYRASSGKAPRFAGLHYYEKVLSDPVVW